jgi:hypothetical protein
MRLYRVRARYFCHCPELNIHLLHERRTIMHSDDSSRRRRVGSGIVAASAAVAVLALAGAAVASPPPPDLLRTSAVTTVPAASVTTTTSVPKPSSAWSFDEGTGTSAADSAGTDTATLGSGASWITGAVGSHAVSLDGSPNGAVVAPTPAVDTSKSFTVSAWVNFSSVGGYQTISGIDGANIGGFFLQLSGQTGKFAMTRRAADSDSAAEVRADSDVATVAGTLYHLVGVDDTAK